MVKPKPKDNPMFLNGLTGVMREPIIQNNFTINIQNLEK
jgi:hypothetical protein